MTRSLVLLVFATVLLSSCAPGLSGRWELTGDLDEPQVRRFAGTLTVDDDGAGRFWYAFGGESREDVPLCRASRAEEKLSFTVDAAQPASQSCEVLPTPLTFDGQIGAHVLTGTVTGADGTPVGRWRAFRVED